MLTNGALRVGESLQLVSLSTPGSLLPALSLSTCQTVLTWIRSLGVGCVALGKPKVVWRCWPLCDFI